MIETMVLPMLDYARVARYIAARLREYFDESGRSTGVVGLSGGVDSSVVACLTTMALGRERTRLYFLPSHVTPREDMEDAMSLIEKLGIPDGNWRMISIDEIVKAFERKLGQMSRVGRGNIMARIRMTILYHEAAANNGLVIGSGDKSEYLSGYFTKHGDGGADVLPIVGLYKTHVRQLAEYLKIPERIWVKPPSPALWPGQTAEEELGVDYTTLDTVLYLRFDKKLSEDTINRVSGIPLETVKRILERVRLTKHKRRLPKRFAIDYEKMSIKTV
ncbi:MAG: NAD+ synthase [Candidatus Jordarchaeales archaeon]